MSGLLQVICTLSLKGNDMRSKFGRLRHVFLLKSAFYQNMECRRVNNLASDDYENNQSMNIVFL